MPVRSNRWDDDPDDEFEDDEFDEDWSDDPDDETATIPCPSCGKDVYDDAAYCPYCNTDLAEAAERTPRRKPWWIIIGTLACLWIFWRWILMR